MSQQINLYQPIFRKEEKKFSTTAMLQAAGLVLAGIVLMYGYMHWQVNLLRTEIKRSEQKLATVTQQYESAGEKFGTPKTSASLDADIQRLEQQIVAKQSIQELLQRGIFSNTHGFSEYFVALARQHIPGIWLTGFNIVGGAEEMALAGRSNDPELVPRYLQKLSAETTLAGIEFRVFQMNRPPADPNDAKAADAPYVEFQIKTANRPG